MATDFPRIKGNIQKMLDGGASEAEIDEYVASEGTTIQALQSHGKMTNQKVKPAPRPPGHFVTLPSDLKGIPQIPPSYLDPKVTERGNLMPLGRTAGGGYTPALPHMAIQAIEAAKLPGKAWQGEQVSPADAANFALTFGTPALRGMNRTVRKMVPRKQTRAEMKAAPTTQELKKQGGKLFNRAEGNTAIISPESYADDLAALEAKMYRKGFDPDMHQPAQAALGALKKRLGKELDMQDMVIVRQLAAEAADNIDPKTARQGSIMVKHIDEYIENLKSSDLVNGDAAGVGETLVKARGLWTQMHKSKIIDDIFERAELQASGFENGLRIGFRALLNNKRKSRSFTADEKAAMKEIAMGNFTRNTLKRLGKLGGGTGQQTNTLGAMGGAGIGGIGGGAVGGPVGAAVGAVGLPALGYGAQKAGEAATKAAARRVRAGVASPPVPPAAAYSGLDDLERAALGQLLQGAATPGMAPKKRGEMSNELMNLLAAQGVI